MSQLSPFLRCFREDWAIPYHRHFCGKYNWVIIIAYTFHFHFSLFFLFIFIFKLKHFSHGTLQQSFWLSQYAGQISLTKIFYLGDFALLKVKRQEWWHTSNLSRAPRVYLCKFFLAGVNSYRFNAKNWHFRQILWEKVVFFTDSTQKIGVFRCKFYSSKILSV